MEKIKLKFLNKELNLTLRDEADVSVMREIFKLREYKAVEEIIKTATLILDVGAHAGFFSIYCNTINPKTIIYAIEPEENNLKILKENLLANKIKEIKIIAGALFFNTGKSFLAIEADNINHHLSKTGVEVKTYSLRDLCKQNKIKRLDLIKMDIEGTEFEIIENWEKNDFKLFKHIIFEYHDNAKNHHQNLEKKLRENGFGVQVFPSKFEKNMGFILANNKRLK